MAPNPTQFATSFKCSRMVIRGEYSGVAVTGEKEGPLALPIADERLITNLQFPRNFANSAGPGIELN